MLSRPTAGCLCRTVGAGVGRDRQSVHRNRLQPHLTASAQAIPQCKCAGERALGHRVSPSSLCGMSPVTRMSATEVAPYSAPSRWPLQRRDLGRWLSRSIPRPAVGTPASRRRTRFAPSSTRSPKLSRPSTDRPAVRQRTALDERRCHDKHRRNFFVFPELLERIQFGE